ncbi:uncharacterized protein SCHCODRAFT_02598814 [Schizophyllum commune H4-8]|uniref:Uncharacterized protein n=1 Tax=Schizophyllum commune (strain H4-8 / FGSC 9210) TaxID=578458 RepID=D8PN14_SCHCM|nr:uncharacterized protein SCHCODRAFT_02598814 [Schizophyllum commune H4-8]KAI5893116.1 hypothetical protein SCHCODRAFT_02598814 [Schizophyllum commune H4-8]
MPKYSTAKSAPSTKYVGQHPYRIISMPGTSTVPVSLPSPLPTAKSAGPSKKTPRSRKGQPRILKAAPPPPPGEHSVYRTEAQRFEYLSTHPWIAAFSVVGARCAACRRRILADIRTKGKYVVPNFTRHIDEKCRARRAIEEGRKPFPEEKKGEKPLETDHRKGRRGLRFEVFAGGAPMPGTILGTKEKAKCVKATKKMDVDEVNLSQTATQSTSQECKRVSISAASVARTPSPPVLPVVIDSPEPAPQHSQHAPHYSQAVPHYSQPMPQYSPPPAVQLLPPRFRMSAAFADHDLTPPSMSQADWDMDSEDGSDDEHAYSAPVDVLYRAERPGAPVERERTSCPWYWTSKRTASNLKKFPLDSRLCDRPSRAKRRSNLASAGLRAKAEESSLTYAEGSSSRKTSLIIALSTSFSDARTSSPANWNGHGTPLVYRAHIYKRGSCVLRHWGRDVWEFSTGVLAIFWRVHEHRLQEQNKEPYNQEAWDEIMEHIEYGFRNPVEAEVNVLVHAGPSLIGAEPLPDGTDPCAYLLEHLFPRCDLETAHQLRQCKRRTGKVYRA